MDMMSVFFFFFLFFWKAKSYCCTYCIVVNPTWSWHISTAAAFWNMCMLFYYFFLKCLIDFFSETTRSGVFLCRKVFDDEFNLFNKMKVLRFLIYPVLVWWLVLFEEIFFFIQVMKFIDIKFFIIFLHYSLKNIFSIYSYLLFHSWDWQFVLLFLKRILLRLID